MEIPAPRALHALAADGESGKQKDVTAGPDPPNTATHLGDVTQRRSLAIQRRVNNHGRRDLTLADVLELCTRLGDSPQRSLVASVSGWPAWRRRC